MPANFTTKPQPDALTDSALARLQERFAQARALHQQGRLASARDAYHEVLEMQPGHFDSLNLLGVLSGQSKDLERAVQYFDQAIKVEPNNAAPYCNRGLALKDLGRLEAALASFDRAIALRSDDAVAYYGRGNIYKDLGRVDAALASYDAALAIDPRFAQAYFYRGLMLQQVQQLDAALASYDQAIAINGGYAEAVANRALALSHLKRFDAALAGYDQAIALQPEHAPTYVHRGNVLKELNRLDEALASYDHAIAIKPDYAEAYSNRGIVLTGMHRIDAALLSYDHAIALNPDYAEAYFNRASVLREAKRFEAAAADYTMADALEPSLKFLPGARFEVRMQVCNWSEYDTEVARMAGAIERDQPASHPFAILTCSDSPRLQRKAAEIWVRETCMADDSLGEIPQRAPHGRIRIGYFSADFREHPVARLVAELIETHDRSRFEVIALSFGPEAQDALRMRLARGFDRFLEVHGKSHLEIAALARSLAVDIAVDLGGYTHNSRPEIFALRAAPIQVGYLGYLGTMGAPWMDYLVADTAIIPAGEQQHYSEKIIYLPSYQVNDSRRRIGTRTFARRELGLPPAGFVFCCLNSIHKITPATFGVWMRIIRRVERSVLFLCTDSQAARRNLLQEAQRRGVDAHRIVFGERLGLEDYLARFRTMDLFLDTLPYNGGTTASDALWAGLPVLTCMGQTFAGRVATSLLMGIDVPELITATAAEYEEKAVELGSNPQRAAELRKKLAANRLTKPLFDSRLFAKHLETAFATIHERYQANLPTAHIHVGFDQASRVQGL